MKIPSIKDSKNLFYGKYRRCFNECTIDQKSEKSNRSKIRTFYSMVSIDDALITPPSTKDQKNLSDSKYRRCSNEGTIDQRFENLFYGKYRRCSNEGAIDQRSENPIRW